MYMYNYIHVHVHAQLYTCTCACTIIYMYMYNYIHVHVHGVLPFKHKLLILYEEAFKISKMIFFLFQCLSTDGSTSGGRYMLRL